MNEFGEYFAKEDYRIASAFPMVADEPGFFAGVGESFIEGPKHGLDVIFSAFAETSEQIAGTMMGKDVAESLRGLTERSRKVAAESRVDPAKMGTAANIIHSVGAVLTEGVIGGVVAGPLGAASAIGGASGYDKYIELRDQNVDKETALKLAGITGVTMGVGAALPPFMGKALSTQIASGVGVNVGLGVVERGASASVLESNGYANIAEHYRMLDGEAVAIDAILGAMFPIGGRLFRPRTSHIDAALVSEQGGAQQTRNPGIDTSLEKLDVNTRALAEADVQLFVEGRNFENLDLPKTGDQIPNPEFDAMMAHGEKAVDDYVMAESGMTRADFDAQIRGEIDDAIRTRSAEKVGVREETEAAKADVAETREDVNPIESAKAELERVANLYPEMKVADENGNFVTVSEMAQKIADVERVSKEDAYLHRVAIACAGIHGN